MEGSRLLVVFLPLHVFDLDKHPVWTNYKVEGGTVELPIGDLVEAILDLQHQLGVLLEVWRSMARSFVL